MAFDDTSSVQLQSILDPVKWLKEVIDSHFNDKKPWQIVLETTATVVAVVWVKNVIFQDESLWQRSKSIFFRWSRKVPYVKKRIEGEVNKIQEIIEDDMNDVTKGMLYISKLPEKGWDEEKILLEAKQYLRLGKFNWNDGSVSGTVYNGNALLTDTMTKVYGLAAWTNPLHPEVFPGVSKMEAEVVRMSCALFNGGPSSCGTMTTGGTESIIMMCKAYRDYARKEWGIRNPRMVIPVTAHAAFDKAVDMLGMKVTKIPVDPVTMKVNVNAMRKAITKDTCMLVASAPQFPHGVMDPVEEIAALGEKYEIFVHVDACLGGFLITFMEEAGFPMRPFDFRLKGVTSISADTHKYGFAPKGSSVILYSDTKFRHYQYFVTPDWPGGIYASPTIGGSRAGGIIAACWAALLSFGREGYIDSTRKIITTARYIADGLKNIDGIYVLGQPEVSVVAFDSKNFSIYRISDLLNKRGWQLNTLQFPSCIHICCTYLHTNEGVADRFLKDVGEVSAEVQKDPEGKLGGTAAMYGTSQAIPDRTLVAELAWIYLDTLYKIPQETEYKSNGKVQLNGN